MAKQILEIMYDGSDTCKLYANTYFIDGVETIGGVANISDATPANKINEHVKQRFKKEFDIFGFKLITV